MTRPIALITGASRGLGKHGALALAAKGVDLIITYRSQAAEAEAVVTQAHALGVRAHALALDVGESATFAAFAEEVTQLLAREWQRTHFNFLVNNAGIGIHASFEQTTEQQFDTLLNIHLKGTFFLTQALLPLLADGGRILNLSTGLTRFAMAQREIGLAAGEPPTTKGYTPTVFTELPKLLERAGPGPIRPDGTRAGPITGLFTVLVDGDDHNEPIADAVRGILDGHIVMERAIAERGRFPAINVLKSISRTMPGCQTPDEREVVRSAREALSAYANMEELIRIGAYRAGADPLIDRAIALNPAVEAFLSQDKDDATGLEASFAGLADILNGVPA